MQFLIVSMLLCSSVIDYLQKLLKLPREVVLAPECLSAIALLVVVARLPRNRLQEIDPKYIAIFALLLFHLIAGFIINSVGPGVIISAVRIYLKAAPFFLIPLLWPQTARQLKTQLWVLAGICLIQFPIAWKQRSSDLWKGSLTGDRTVGTMNISSNLSIFIICAAAVALALYMKGKLRIRWLILFLALTLPATMINETKGSLFLAPIAFLMTAFLAPRTAGGASVFKRNMMALFLVAGFLSAFIPVYDYYIEARWHKGILDFLTEKGRVQGYLSKNADLGAGSTDNGVGRVDSFILPFVAARHDPVQAAFGLGAGNISKSSLGPNFSGAYLLRYGPLSGPSASVLLWETGWMGLMWVLLLNFFIFRDAMMARYASGIEGGIALGWLAVTFIMTGTLFYNKAIQTGAQGYIYFFYSGVVAATALRLRNRAGERTTAARLRLGREEPLQGTPPLPAKGAVSARTQSGKAPQPNKTSAARLAD